tara:strand:- start:97 stop:552 length:456 start_codon:yes stop_codon:yes gene_type:complete
MEKKLFRKKNKFFSKLLNGIFLSYVSVDNMLDGPFRKFLKLYFDLEEFGSNNREESLYYLILIFGLLQIVISLQALFQPVIEIKNGKIALKTKDKILSVINPVDEITNIKERDEDTIIFSFQEKSYAVVIKDIDNREVELLLNEIKSAISD